MSFGVLVAIASVLLVSDNVSANPVFIEGPEILLLIIGIFFVVNLPINMFWYSIGALLLLRIGRLEFRGDVAFNPTQLRKTIAKTVAWITLIGAMIDMMWVEAEPFWMREESDIFVIMLVLVTFSVIAFSFWSLKLRVKPSVMMAGGMAVMNLVHWVVVTSVFYGDADYENPFPFVAVYIVVCASLSVIILRLLGNMVRAAPESSRASESIETKAG